MKARDRRRTSGLLRYVFAAGRSLGGSIFFSTSPSATELWCENFVSPLLQQQGAEEVPNIGIVLLLLLFRHMAEW
jgi:hypothetical protein